MNTINTIKKKIEQNNGAEKIHKKITSIINEYRDKHKELDLEMDNKISKLTYAWLWDNPAYEKFIKDNENI